MKPDVLPQSMPTYTINLGILIATGRALADKDVFSRDAEPVFLFRFSRGSYPH
jgi:hypothetical protein